MNRNAPEMQEGMGFSRDLQGPWFEYDSFPNSPGLGVDDPRLATPLWPWPPRAFGVLFRQAVSAHAEGSVAQDPPPESLGLQPREA